MHYLESKRFDEPGEYLLEPWRFLTDWCGISQRMNNIMLTQDTKMAKICEKRARGDEGTSSKKSEEEEKVWRRIWSLDIEKKI